MEDQPARIRPTWVTASFVSVGIVFGPIVLLALALAVEALLGLQDSGAIGVAFAVYVVMGVGVAAIRYARPLGVGMLLGSLAIVLMFLARGGTMDPTI